MSIIGAKPVIYRKVNDRAIHRGSWTRINTVDFPGWQFSCMYSSRITFFIWRNKEELEKWSIFFSKSKNNMRDVQKVCIYPSQPYCQDVVQGQILIICNILTLPVCSVPPRWVGIYLHICIFRQHFFVNANFIKHNRHFMPTYSLLDPFEFPYYFYRIRGELI